MLDGDFQVDSATVSGLVLDFPHVVFAPLHYEPGYAYPLVVWLHGSGDDERQLPRIMPLVSMRNYLAVAPRGLCLPDERNKHGWLQTEDHIQQAEQRVFDCIELACRKFRVHPGRVFLAGFSHGGTMAMRIGLSHPGRFAGVVSLGGAIPKGGALLGNLAMARRLGFFFASGRVSREYPTSHVCEDLRLLHAAGLSITLRQYPCGQELMPQMLADVDRWIIDQIAPPQVAAAAVSNCEWSCDE